MDVPEAKTIADGVRVLKAPEVHTQFPLGWTADEVPAQNLSLRKAKRTTIHSYVELNRLVLFSSSLLNERKGLTQHPNITCCSIPQIEPTSQQPRNNRLPPPNLLPPKLLHIPPPPGQRPRRHSSNLIKQKIPRRDTPPPANQPKRRPLAPLAQVMRVEDVMEKPVLRHHVQLVDALRFASLFLLLRSFFLPAHSGPPNLAQIVVVENIAHETPAPEHQTNFDGVQPPSPVISRRGPVTRAPAGDTERIDTRKDNRRNSDQRVDGRHTGIQPQRRQPGAVDVVDYVKAGHGPVSPW